MTYITQRKGEAGIVYCHSRKTVENIATKLQKEGVKALPYHAGLPDAVKKQNQERFLRDDVDVIVATIAFGMGINKSNVRFIIHYDLPKTLEHYYQETGRAGRDGLPSECIFLYSYADKFSHEGFIQEKENEAERKIAQMQLQRVVDYAQSKLCRRALLLQYFAEEVTKSNCASCDNCLRPKETFDATILTQKILSCVYRVQERFGIGYIVNILTGSKVQRLLDNNHDKLSTYGIITDYSPLDIKTFIYELVHLGLLKQSQDQYTILSLTPKSKAILQGKEKVFLTKPPERQLKKIKVRKVIDEGPINKELFNRLRTLRKGLADEKNLPPYIIFSDATLKEMTIQLPQTKEQFAKIKGVGEHKLKLYADLFLAEIIAFGTI
jgi:ATP-dependent DNA helicase RecQ